MSKQLENLVEEYIHNHQDVIKIKSDGQNNDFYILAHDAIKKKLIEDVKEEIVSEEKESIIKDAEIEIQKIKDRKYIEELKVLIGEGFVVAFFVGLLVNQVTDLISIFKGTLYNEVLLKTIVIAVMLFALCVGIFIFNYLVKVVRYIKLQLSATK